jgi:hypothetical protein
VSGVTGWDVRAVTHRYALIRSRIRLKDPVTSPQAGAIAVPERSKALADSGHTRNGEERLRCEFRLAEQMGKQPQSENLQRELSLDH